MRFAPVRHMAWAKQVQLIAPVRLNLSTSAVPTPTLEEIGGLPSPFPMTANNAYGHPGILDFLSGRYGLPSDCFLPVSGTSLGNFLVCAACVQPGQRVVMETPVYEPLLRIAENMDAKVAFVRRRFEDGWKLDLQALAGACAGGCALVMLTNLHNPSGAGMDEATVREAARIAADAGATLLVDEVYLDSAFAMTPRPKPAATLAENAVSTASWTKSYGMGTFRSGWIAASAQMILRLREVRDSVDVSNPLPADQLALQAWRRREALLALSEHRFRENWAVMAAWFKAHPAWRCTTPGGGFVCFPKVPEGVDSPGLLQRLLERHGCAVVPGEFFREPGHIRIGFGCERAELEEGLAALALEAAK